MTPIKRITLEPIDDIVLTPDDIDSSDDIENREIVDGRFINDRVRARRETRGHSVRVFQRARSIPNDITRKEDEKT